MEPKYEGHSESFLHCLRNLKLQYPHFQGIKWILFEHHTAIYSPISSQQDALSWIFLSASNENYGFLNQKLGVFHSQAIFDLTGHNNF